MKISISLLIVAGICFIMTSCQKNTSNSQSSIQTQVKTNAQNGNWRITKYLDSGTDELNHYTGYSFIFNNSAVLIAQNGANSYSGTWSVTDSNSGDDSQDDLDFNISFNVNNNFDDLSDDWHFISQSSNKIELIDVSGGNGGTDYLTFEKN